MCLVTLNCFFFYLNGSNHRVIWLEEDFGAGYLVQPVGQAEALNDVVVDTDEVENEDGEEEEEVDDDDDEDNDVQEVLPPPASSHPKRKRDNDDDDEDDEDDEGFTKPSKKHH
ncbi:hypothetical protein TSUD_211170 [Trifolium subterraneum]|uniref:Uncharacterized protein n=1 Tax=Trifolium subterraneum TaxID=3900 RepID=A0A2Z6N857_TRISU|nr:hypothetical protein TSUD_211170 [Trifolium subterraneum]